MGKRLNLILLAIILFLAAWLRLFWLGGSSLWSDEGNTWALIGRGFGQIARDAAADIHPPGYYWALKVWTSFFGATVIGMRSFSAAAGVILVWIIYALGRWLDQRKGLQATALLAAFMAALNPFQIYYSQEARMYMLLTLESAGLFLALFALRERQRATPEQDRGRDWLNWPAAGFVLWGIAGLWTHYSFPVILAAAGAAYLIDWARDGRDTPGGRPAAFMYFVILNAIVLVAYLPWLPTAMDRVLAWPKGGESIPFLEGAMLTFQTLLFGPLTSLPEPLWPWLVWAVALPLAGMAALRRERTMPGLAAWLLAPIGLMFGLGLFSDAFLKFLLVASPAWVLLSAGAGRVARPNWPWQTLLALGALAVAAVSLPSYYGNPTVRDNYAGVARYVAATGDPARDIVLLDAPGQQEVWSYYAPPVPVLPLPAQRPPDRAATEAALADALAPGARVFALFWAEDEADPERMVETWLDTHAFKGLDTWQGDMRLVIYDVPGELQCTPLDPAPIFGQRMKLAELCLPAAGETGAGVTPGEAGLVGLRWQALEPMDRRYKISLQLLDDRGLVVAQQDTEPAGGARPTVDWTPGETIADNHGLPIPPGTPPGAYRLIAAVYDAETGERLPVGEGDAAELGTMTIVNPPTSPPADLLNLAHRVDAPLGPVMFLGYDQHKLGYAHAPETPVEPGDAVTFTLYWQAPDPLPPDWPDDLTFTLELGGNSTTLPLAGGGFPTGEWTPGQLVRTVVRLPYDGGDRRARLIVGEDAVRFKALPR